MLSNQSIITILLPAMIAGMFATLINWRIHREMEGVGYWPMGTAISIVGGILRAVDTEIPEGITIIVGNVLIVGGQFVMLHGLCKFAGTPVLTRTSAAVLAVLIASLAYFIWVTPNGLARTIIFTAVLATTFFLQAPALMRLWRDDGFAGVAVLAFVYTVGLAILLWRLAFMTLNGGLPSLDFSIETLNTPGQINQALLLIYATVLATLRAYGYILLSTNRLQIKLRQTATVDDLTGLPNRRGFEDEMRRIVPRIRRDKITFGLAVMDIDYFKRINDTHGHAGGDAMLRHFAAAVRKVLRDSDFFARVGGEEFVLVVADTTAAALRQAAERICHALEQSPLDLPAGPIQATISAGLAVSGPGETDYQAIYSRADAALYRAKAAGRNRIESSEDSVPDEAGLANTQPALT